MLLDFSSNHIVALLGGARMEMQKQLDNKKEHVLQVIRGLLFVIFWPFLKKMGYGLTPTDALVLSW